jgi:type IV pilus assembly protein PilP
MNRRHAVLMALPMAIAFALAACGDKVIDAPAGPPPGAPGAAPSVAARASASASSSALPPPVFTEADFTESESSRDPFHTFERLFLPSNDTKVAAPTYTVLLEKYAIDELRLVAIVNAGDGMRAMFVDPQGKGWVIHRNDHLGRGEIVRIGNSMSSYPLHWKVDKIKTDEVVLVREDTLHPELQPTYREIPLHSESEKS